LAYQQNPVPYTRTDSIAVGVNAALTAGAASFAGASSCLLSKAYNRISAVAVANGGALLPPAQNVGQTIVVRNDAATNAAQIYGDNGDTVSGIAGTTGVSLAAGDQAEFTCYQAGAWAGPKAEV
jgi:hypothetical protein